MVALDPTRARPAHTDLSPTARPKLRGHIAGAALAIIGGFVAGICIANPGAAIIRDSLIGLMAISAVAALKRPSR
ncbi:MAG: hypothetical protein ACRDV3_07495 [Acidothermaceae bacterium]